MSALTPADQRRLQASLALLASDRDGEVIAAVAAVKRILAKAGAQLIDLELPANLTPTSRQPTHQVRAERLLGCGWAWTPWAEDFLRGIVAWRSPLSARQEEILRDMEAEAHMDRAA